MLGQESTVFKNLTCFGPQFAFLACRVNVFNLWSAKFTGKDNRNWNTNKPMDTKIQDSMMFFICI